MTFATFTLDRDEMLAFGIAFESACEELGVGTTSLDVSKRERIACLILSLINGGESNPEVLRKRAVLYLTNTAAIAA
jgi:hypothetical protein